jgi:hypothetical protein
MNHYSNDIAFDNWMCFRVRFSYYKFSCRVFELESHDKKVFQLNEEKEENKYWKY